MSNTVITDAQIYNNGSYTGYIAPFGLSALKNGVNYNETITLANNSSSNTSVMSWSLPNEKTVSILSFLALDFGNYCYTSPQSPVVSSALSGLTTLTASSNFTLSGNTSGFDVIDDLFLTSAAGGSNPASAEVEVFLHTPTYSQSWISTLKTVGSVVASGITWNVDVGKDSQGVSDYIFAPSNLQDVTSTAVDVKTMLQYLVTKGSVSGSLFFNGMAFGAETESGSGSLNLSNFSVAYASTTPQPKVTISLAHETGATIGNSEYTNTPALTGQADANSTVAIFDGSAHLASVTANAQGVWAYNPNLSNGYHDLIAHETNSSGTTATASVAIMLNETPINLSEGVTYVSGQGKNGIYTTDPQFTGWTPPYTTVSLHDGTTSLGQVVSNSAGYWSYNTTHLSLGSHDIIASVDDIYGRTATVASKFSIA